MARHNIKGKDPADMTQNELRQLEKAKRSGDARPVKVCRVAPKHPCTPEACPQARLNLMERLTA